MSHLNNIINMIGECICNRHRIISSYIISEDINLYKFKISNLSLLGLYFLSQMQVVIDLDIQQEINLNTIFILISNYIDDIINYHLINHNCVYIDKNGHIDFTIIKIEIGNEVYNLLKEKLEYRINLSVQLSIKYIFSNLETYQNGIGSVKKENGELCIYIDEPELIKYIEEETGNRQLKECMLEI